MAADPLARLFRSDTAGQGVQQFARAQLVSWNAGTLANLVEIDGVQYPNCSLVGAGELLQGDRVLVVFVPGGPVILGRLRTP